jgi:hypothetical protein
VSCTIALLRGNESCPVAFEVELVPAAGLVLEYVPPPVSFQIENVIAFPAGVNSVGCPIEVLVEEELNGCVAGPHDVSHQFRIRGQPAKAGESPSLFRVEQRVASGIKGSSKERVQGLIESGTYAGVPVRVDPGIEPRINRGIDLRIDRRVELGIDRSVVLRASERIRHLFRPKSARLQGDLVDLGRFELPTPWLQTVNRGFAIVCGGVKLSNVYAPAMRVPLIHQAR